ncbi:MAG: hypothetical protein QW292_12880 [Candidatus Parvarchaeota archaeon]
MRNRGGGQKNTQFYRSIGIEPDVVTPDDVRCDDKLNIDLFDLSPEIEAPYLPANVRDVAEYAETKIDLTYLGNYANGTIGDLREAAEILRRQQVADGTKLIIVPAMGKVYQQAMGNGLLKIFVDSDTVVKQSTWVFVPVCFLVCLVKERQP